jgi:hypothetical protein
MQKNLLYCALFGLALAWGGVVVAASSEAGISASVTLAVSQVNQAEGVL